MEFTNDMLIHAAITNLDAKMQMLDKVVGRPGAARMDRRIFINDTLQALKVLEEAVKGLR
jgi:hypothetical protein